MSDQQPRYDMHSHTFLSDGILLPIELIRRAYSLNHRAIAITDHVSYSNVDQIVPSIVRDCESIDDWDILAIPGAEITHVPPGKLDALVSKARRAGAAVIVVHGETPMEPVSPGTNRKAVENPDVHILAHPGFITPDEAEIAKKNEVYLEITCRSGHSLTNGHVYATGSKVGADFLVNTDAHDTDDLSTHSSAKKVAIGAGMSGEEAERVLLQNPLDLINKIGL